MTKSVTFTANEKDEFNEVGDFFRYLEGPNPIDVTYYRAGRAVAGAMGVRAGYGEKFDVPFDRFEIKSPTAQTVQFVVRQGAEIRYDRGAAAVTVTNTGGPFAQSAKTVTSSSAQLLAANAARRYLLIQNKDSSGSIWVNLMGQPSTPSNGILILPGGSFELSAFVPTGEIFAIGSIANNPNVVVVEG